MIKMFSNIRKFIQNRNIKHWQYLFIAFLLAIALPIFWFYFAAITQSELGVLSIFNALLQGFVAYLFMQEKGEAKKVFFSLTFTFLGYFLGKYLLFEHYYDWFLSAYVNKSEVNLSLIIFYIKAINLESIKLFISQKEVVLAFSDIILICINIMLAMIYMILPFNNSDTVDKAAKRKKFKKRRFN